MALEHKIAPSILSADFARLGDEVRRVEEAGADLIHFDVMDGHFVPNLSIGVPVLKSLRKITRLPLDAHLMISEPARYLKAFVEAGADSISVHAEVVRRFARDRCANPRTWRARLGCDQSRDSGRTGCSPRPSIST